MQGLGRGWAAAKVGIWVSCLALSVGGMSATAAPVEGVNVATGGVTGVYYAAGGALCRLVNKNRAQHKLRCTAEATGGSLFNISALYTEDFDIAIVQSDIGYHAYQGQEQFDEPFTDLRALFSIHAEPLTAVVRPESTIQSFADLQGKRVNIGHPGSGTRQLVELLLETKGVDTDFFGQAMELRPDEHGQALCADKIDGFFYGVGHPTANIQEPTATCGAQLLSLDDEAVKQLVAERPYYAKAVIPGGTYADNPHDTVTYGPVATVLTTTALSDEAAYQVVKAVFENFDDFKRLHPAWAHLNKQDMVSLGMVVPLHTGAERYFREVGLLP